LGVFFVLLFVNIMQKPLNIHQFAHFSLARKMQQIFSSSRASLVAVMVLLLAALSINSAQAADFTSNLVFITGNRSFQNSTPTPVNLTYSTNNPTAAMLFNVSNPLGSFDQTTTRVDQLFINAESNTSAGTGETVAPPTLYYRVYRKDSNREEAGGFIPLQLGLVSGSPTGNARWNNLTNRINLIQYAPTPGDYIVEVYFQTFITLPGTPTSAPPTPLFDGNDIVPYSNTFYQYVNGEKYVRATWNPSSTSPSRSWSYGPNWSGGRTPDSNTDVTIPYVRSTNLTYPVISNGDIPAQVHNLTLAGTTPTQKAALSLNGSSLSIYGNFQDPFGGFSQAEAGFLVLSGTESQVFDESSRTTNPFSLFNLGLTGIGTKSITANVTVNKRIAFAIDQFTGQPLSGPLTTNNFAIILGPNGVLANETETASVQGTVTSARTVTNQSANDFGNIGVTITANNNDAGAIAPGFTTVTRNNYVYFGTGTSQSINRSFTFVPANTNIPQFDLVFGYLNADLNGIVASNLRLFRSDNGDIPFEGLGKTGSTANTLTRTGITGNLAALFTLGDVNNPLPVTITSFTAVAQGADAVLNWATASETNNQGFEVQVSTDGTTFTKLGFLAANTPNSTTPHSYQYRDVTAGKQGIRYYRLRQLDLDGTQSFVGPRAVTFGEGGVAQATSLQGYPSPFTSEINLALQPTAAGLATVTVTDGVGRPVRTWQPTLAAGASTLRLADLQSIPAGIYVVQVRYNDGQTQRLKVVKE
jgi:hypothetical protein